MEAPKPIPVTDADKVDLTRLVVATYQLIYGVSFVDMAGALGRTVQSIWRLFSGKVKQIKEIDPQRAQAFHDELRVLKAVNFPSDEKGYFPDLAVTAQNAAFVRAVMDAALDAKTLSPVNTWRAVCHLSEANLILSFDNSGKAIKGELDKVAANYETLKKMSTLVPVESRRAVELSLESNFCSIQLLSEMADGLGEEPPVLVRLKNIMADLEKEYFSTRYSGQKPVLRYLIAGTGHAIGEIFVERGRKIEVIAVMDRLLSTVFTGPDDRNLLEICFFDWAWDHNKKIYAELFNRPELLEGQAQ